MSSPWPPRVIAVTSLTETPSSQAMKAAKRAESSTPAWPITRLCGKPVMLWQRVTIASSGLEMTMTKDFGAYCLMPSATCVMILELTAIRSSRLMPGLRGRPAVTMHDVGAGDVGVAVGALQADVEAVDRGDLGDVEHLALGQPFDDVEQHHVTEFAQGAELGQHAADLPAADETQSSSLPWLSPSGCEVGSN